MLFVKFTVGVIFKSVVISLQDHSVFIIEFIMQW